MVKYSKMDGHLRALNVFQGDNMALSNWDCLAFDAEGKPGSGEVRNTNAAVEIYKNWVYVEFPSFGYEKEGTSNVHSIQEGDIQIGGFRILAKRYESQQAVFVLVEQGYTGVPVMAGIGCYGYSEQGEFVGVLPETLEEFLAWLSSLYKDQAQEWLDKVKSSRKVRVNQGDKYFSQQFGVDDQATEVGKTQEPIISQITKTVFKS